MDSSTCRHPGTPVPFVEDAFIFPLYVFDFFVKYQIFIGMWVYFQVFNSVLLINLSVSISISFRAVLKSGMVIPIEVLFIVQHCVSYPGFFLFFPYEVENYPFKVSKELCWNFYGDCIEFVDCFW